MTRYARTSWEDFFIVVLISLNGFLAATKIAVVTARKSHIEQVVKNVR